MKFYPHAKFHIMFKVSLKKLTKKHVATFPAQYIMIPYYAVPNLGQDSISNFCEILSLH